MNCLWGNELFFKKSLKSNPASHRYSLDYVAGLVRTSVESLPDSSWNPDLTYCSVRSFSSGDYQSKAPRALAPSLAPLHPDVPRHGMCRWETKFDLHAPGRVTPHVTFASGSRSRTRGSWISCGSTSTRGCKEEAWLFGRSVSGRWNGWAHIADAHRRTDVEPWTR